MLKALMKKQFLELNAFYFQNRKTGKNRSRAGTIGFIALYVVIFLGLAGTFFMVASSLAAALAPMGYGWLFFAIMGLIALAFGIFGSVFNTYAGLYHAKDNELLLAMPIPPRYILTVRMVGVYAMSMLYAGVIMVPTIVAAQLQSPGLWPLIVQILLYLLLGLIVMTLTCFLGWIVALISARLKNKSFITVILSLGFLAIYYIVYFRVNSFLRNIMQHADALSRTMKTLYPVYAFGRAGEGDAISLLAFAAIALVLAAVCIVLMSRSFIRIVTMNRGEGAEKKDYRTQAAQKASGISAALLRKEFRRFTASPTYMLNSGLGLVFMVAAAVAAFIKMDAVRDFLAQLAESAPEVMPALPILSCGIVMLLAAMNPITAPSISLEGKNIWILQSLPVRPEDILTAKQRLQLYLCAGPTVLVGVAVAIAIGADWPTALYMIVLALLFSMLFGSLGLIVNLKKPTLNWTNETVPVKQGMPVAVVLFGGWLVSALFVGGFFLLRKWVNADYYMLGCIVAFALICRLLNRWLMSRGAEVFAAL